MTDETPAAPPTYGTGAGNHAETARTAPRSVQGVQTRASGPSADPVASERRCMTDPEVQAPDLLNALDRDARPTAPTEPRDPILRGHTTMTTTTTTPAPRFARLADDRLSCAWCGVELDPGAPALEEVLIHPHGVAPAPTWREPMGCCEDCRPWADLADKLAERAELRALGPAGAERLGRAIASTCCLLDADPPHVDAPAAELRSWSRAFAETPAPTWASAVAGLGAASTACTTRWAHVDEDHRAELRAVLARVLAERMAGARPPVRIGPPRVLTISGETAWSGRCLVCGTDHVDMPAVQVLELGGPTAAAREIWTRHTLSTGRGPERLAGYCCPGCEEAIRAAGNVIGPTAYDVALTAHLGLRTGTVAAGMYRVDAVPAWQTHRSLGGAPWSHYHHDELDDLRAEILPDLGQPDKDEEA